ncbi:transketolase [candidate division KSB1 bacterium]|nr:MAG: transketolase [candidate division KSB1 bacterium]
MNKAGDSREIAELSVNTIRMLSVDAIQKANSGHPGMPMGMADCAFVLWTKFLNYNPDKPLWKNRDRFILSAGHGSMLLYSLLYLSGYDFSLEDIKSFRQWGSKTPGHPEYGFPGIETTTGPLGQGFATGVGMAIAEKIMAQKFNTKNFSPVNHKIFGIVSDGDLMEGVASEAASVAGHLGLGNIIYIYDHNKITIEGSTDFAFTEDVKKRFDAYGWHTILIDGHDHQQIETAIEESLNETSKPSLIIAKTHIGFGSPEKQDTASVHGSPLGAEEVKRTKKNLKWPEDKDFYIPEQVTEFFNSVKEIKIKEYNSWVEKFTKWRMDHPELARDWDVMYKQEIPENLEEELLNSVPEEPCATRVASGKIINKAAEIMPWLYGGSADLAPSTKTYLINFKSISKDDFSGRNIHFGIREHAMTAIMNGMSLYGSFVPFGSTFLVFSDYMKPAIRMSALMKLQNIYVFTHDSIFVGEDGPTHQPVEHIAALRGIPGLTVFRPADSVETALCWTYALTNKRCPAALCLTRQKIQTLKRDKSVSVEDIKKGGYIIRHEKNKPDVVLVATGSEVELSLNSAEDLNLKGIDARVVSMVSLDLFYNQDIVFQENIIPKGVPVVVVEAASSQGWYRITRNPILCLTMDRFGESAPYQVLADKFGFTRENITKAVEFWLVNLKV